MTRCEPSAPGTVGRTLKFSNLRPNAGIPSAFATKAAIEFRSVRVCTISIPMSRELVIRERKPFQDRKNLLEGVHFHGCNRSVTHAEIQWQAVLGGLEDGALAAALLAGSLDSPAH